MKKKRVTDRPNPETSDAACLEEGHRASASVSTATDDQTGEQQIIQVQPIIERQLADQGVQQLIEEIVADHIANVSCSVEASGSQQVVSPECIRPFPTAQPRKTNRKRLGKSRILTDTPVKNEISQQKRRNETDVHKRKSLKKKSRQNCRKKLKYNSTVDATSSLFVQTESNLTCLYCNMLYSESRKELRHWIQCQGKCAKWAHVVCAGVNKKQSHFICEMCA
jgi:hypothetical protein